MTERNPIQEFASHLKTERRRIVMMMAHGDGEKPSLEYLNPLAAIQAALTAVEAVISETGE